MREAYRDMRTGAGRKLVLAVPTGALGAEGWVCSPTFATDVMSTGGWR